MRLLWLLKISILVKMLDICKCTKNHKYSRQLLCASNKNILIGMLYVLHATVPKSVLRFYSKLVYMSRFKHIKSRWILKIKSISAANFGFIILPHFWVRLWVFQPIHHPKNCSYNYRWQFIQWQWFCTIWITANIREKTQNLFQIYLTNTGIWVCSSAKLLYINFNFERELKFMRFWAVRGWLERYFSFIIKNSRTKENVL